MSGPSSPSKSTETKIEENYHQVFDAGTPFEFLHREYAPSPEEYLHLKEQEMKPRKQQAMQMSNVIFSAIAGDDNREQAVFSYLAKEEGELSFSKGDVIDVVERLEDGWWLGALGNSRGVFPCNHTRPFIPLPKD
mmetsp:Transcript_12714/g.25954  ORF Transcript_12714/g.25954 Transcript_12714/m.25954 type:complete len:135 (+) Transcript_12714:458-862(+)